MIRNHSPIGKLQKTGNRIPVEPLGCYSMKEFCILLPHLDVPNGTSLFFKKTQTLRFFSLKGGASYMPPRRGVYSLCYNDLGGHPRCLGSPIEGLKPQPQLIERPLLWFSLLARGRMVDPHRRHKHFVVSKSSIPSVASRLPVPCEAVWGSSPWQQATSGDGGIPVRWSARHP